MNRLVVQYYFEKNKTRRAEYHLCLAVNADTFDEVLILAEHVEESPFALPDNVRWVNCPERPQMYTAIKQIWALGEYCDTVNVIANTDIIIPMRAIQQIEANLTSDQAYCLARIESPGMEVFNVEYSQDVWAFRGKPKSCDIGHFWFGVLGCDNAIANDFRIAGYEVMNPSLDVRTYHVHNSGMRTPTTKQKYRVAKPYLDVAPARLNETPKTTIRMPQKIFGKIS